MGKPVITFSFHNIYNCVPHVKAVDALTGLRGELATMCEPVSPEVALRRRIDGARFLEALKSVSIDVSGWNPYAPGRAPAGEAERERFLETLNRSLQAAPALAGAEPVAP